MRRLFLCDEPCRNFSSASTIFRCSSHLCSPLCGRKPRVTRHCDLTVTPALLCDPFDCIVSVSSFLCAVDDIVALRHEGSTGVNIDNCIPSITSFGRIRGLPLFQATCCASWDPYTERQHVKSLFACILLVRILRSKARSQESISPVPVLPYGLQGIIAGMRTPSSVSAGRKTSPNSFVPSRIRISTSFSQIISHGNMRRPSSLVQPLGSRLISWP